MVGYLFATPASATTTAVFSSRYIHTLPYLGIPDFRGKHGVWTLEKQGQPLPSYEKCWDNAVPTLGHMALAGLVNEGLVHAIVSQNVDGKGGETDTPGGIDDSRHPQHFGHPFFHRHLCSVRPTVSSGCACARCVLVFCR